ncbi:hypothetical protein JVU11DRAFT_274 [Chiua virens]|nr:hypothetical protein JVU11DRAFT_274 [Chiua virens]
MKKTKTHPLPRPDDLAEGLNALSLADKKATEKPPYLPPRVENLDGLSLADKRLADLPPCVEKLKGLSLADKEPADLPPLIQDLNRLSIADKQPAQKKHSALPPQTRCDLVENRNARSLAGKKLAEKKLPPAINAEVDSHRHPLASRLPIVNQSARLAVPPEATIVPSNQKETPIPRSAPQGIPTKLALAPHTAVISPRQHSDSIPSPGAALKLSRSAVTRPAEPVLNITPSRARIISSAPCLKAAKSCPRQKKEKKAATARCSGMTQAGKHCLKKSKIPVTYSHLNPMPALYCYHHKPRDPQMLITRWQRSFYVQQAFGGETWAEFSDYIPGCLQIDTQLALRVEMAKKPASDDGPGYIYVFEMRDPKRSNVIQLKVGHTRADDLTKSLDQSDGQNEQPTSKARNILRGWWPGTVEDEDGTGGSLPKGNIKAGDPNPFCHLVKRLVHIELSDLSLYEPYNRYPNWQDKTFILPLGADAASPASTIKEPCFDCGVPHGEIFSFRHPKGRYNGKEWSQIVKPVIERWGEFVNKYHGNSLPGRTTDSDRANLAGSTKGL